eukprot:COSAG01_NODE_5927_length_3948_cov_1.717849_3_plen_139_part_00
MLLVQQRTRPEMQTRQRRREMDSVSEVPPKSIFQPDAFHMMLSWMSYHELPVANMSTSCERESSEDSRQAGSQCGRRDTHRQTRGLTCQREGGAWPALTIIRVMALRRAAAYVHHNPTGVSCSPAPPPRAFSNGHHTH